MPLDFWKQNHQPSCASPDWLLRFNIILLLPTPSLHHRIAHAHQVSGQSTDMNLQGQDWGEVVIRKKKPTAAASQTESAVNAARRQGEAVDTVKKFSAGANKSTGTGKDAAKLDRETEETHHERVPSELKKRISQARLDKKLTQAQLAQQINEKPSVINEYESGKAIPNPQVLSKMSKVLGVQLSQKSIAKKKTQA